MYSINWQKKARKQFNKIDHLQQINILDAVDTLASFPNVTNVISLKNHKHEYRLRVGNYRILFDADTAVRIIDIQQVSKRDDNTY